MVPSVSINLCCYNSEKYLKETLDSIIAQTYKDWELVIINDGSSDSTETIIREYIKQGYRITYHYQENRGIGFSRNEALKRSQGEYIAFIDHDDVWLPEKLSKQVEYMCNHESVGLCYGASYKIYGRKKTKTLFTPFEKFETGWVFDKLLFTNFANLSTVLINRERVGDELFFLDEFRHAEEYELFLRLSLKAEFGCLFEPLAYYRLHENNSGKKNIEIGIKEREILDKKYSKEILKFRSSFRALESLKARGIVLFYLHQEDEAALQENLHLLRLQKNIKNTAMYLLIKLKLRFFLSERCLDVFKTFRSFLLSFRCLSKNGKIL